MFPLTYQILLILFACLFSVLFYFKLRHPIIEKAKVDGKRFELLLFCITIAILVIPWILYAVFSTEGFRGSDIFSYIPDSQKILVYGHIPPYNLSNIEKIQIYGYLAEPTNVLSQCSYYSSFPIFTLLLSSISAVTGLSIMATANLLNILIQLVFWVSSILLIMELGKGTLNYRYVFLGIIIAAFANPYLYGYFNTPLPQTLGLDILLLLLLILIKKTGVSFSIIYPLLLIVGLVHVTILPLLLIILALYSLSTLIFSRHGLITVPKNPIKWKLLPVSLLPTVIFAIYLVFTIAFSVFSGYFENILGFFSSLSKDALAGQVAVTSGLSRGVLYPLNALGPALIIGANLCCIILFLQAIKQRKEVNNWLVIIAFTSLFFIVLGTARGQFASAWGDNFFSISRYFNLPGFALGSVVAGYVVSKSFVNTQKNWILVALFGLFTLSAIGGLLDPLVF